MTGSSLLNTTPPGLSGGLLTTIKTSPLGVLTSTTNLPSSMGLASPLSGSSALAGQSAAAKAASSATAKVDANIVQTRPLFDKTNATLIKLRRDVKMQKMKGWPTYKIDLIRSTLPVQPEMAFGLDQWWPNDDFIILYVYFHFLFSFINCNCSCILIVIKAFLNRYFRLETILC